MTSYNSHGRSKNIKNTKIELTILNGNANNSSNQNNNDKSINLVENNNENSYKNNNVIIAINMA